MRVLHVVNGLHLGGGIESFLVNFFRALDHEGPEQEVCFTGPSAGSLAEEVTRRGIAVWGCRMNGHPFSFVRRFRSELRARRRFDVVHSHLGSFGAPALSVAATLGVPTRIAHYHNLQAGHRNDWSRRLFESWLRHQTLACATGIAGCSWAALQAHFPHLWDRDGRMCVIRNGLAQRPPLEPSVRNDVRRELGIAVDAPVVGHVGRFNWQKNHRVLIEAAQRLVETRASVRFVLVGDGELRSQIEQQARDVGLRKHVILTGWRSDVSRLLSAMDVFAFPSKCEAFGLAAIEAQAAGLPVAASNLPGIREALAPEFVRYTVRHDDAAALASSIDALLKRSRTDAQLSAAARVFAARFSAEATRDAMLAAWRRGEARDSSESAPRRSVATDPAGAALARSALVGAAGR